MTSFLVPTAAQLTLAQGVFSYACDISHHVEHQAGVLVRPYQVEGIARGISGNILLNFEPGLGKTITATAAVKNRGPVLFCIPKVARSIWLKEICRCKTDEIIELEGSKRLRAVRRRLEGGNVIFEEPLTEGTFHDGTFVVTHDCIASWADTIKIGRLNLKVNRADAAPIQIPRVWDAVVLDESHRMADRNAKRTMGFSKVASISDRVVLLSGTPDMGGVQNLWVQLCLLRPQEWGTYNEFIVRYAGAAQTKYGLQPTGGTNLEELACRMAPLVLTYRQAEVAPYLPKHTRDRVLVPLTGDQARTLGNAIAAAQKALQALGTARLDRSSWFLPGEVIEARLGCAMAKVPSVVEMAKELVLGLKERVVIWTWHKKPAAAVAEELRRLKIPCFVVTGETSDQQLDRHLSRWSGPEGGVIIATIARLGEGEDRLVAAAWQLFLEIDWLPQRVQQAEHRLLRLSQKRPVNTRFFQLDMPFERSFMDRVLQRASDTDALLGSSSALDIGELFGAGKILSDEELLLRMSQRLG